MICSKTNLAYLAGIIDGEGTISIHHGRDGFGGPYLQAGGTDKRLVDWLKTTFGGNYTYYHLTGMKHRNHKDFYLWRLNLSSVSKTLIDILPYLKLKMKQAELAIQFRNTIGRVGLSVTSDVYNIRLNIYNQMRILNKRGK